MSFEEDRAVMIAYLELKKRQQDWHGVMDAAADLRDMDEYHRGFKNGELVKRLMTVGDT